MLRLALDGELFDAIVCDPPYDLTSVVDRFGAEGSAPAQHGRDGAFARQSRGFMGKRWDGTGIAFDPDTWRPAFDVLKPGAHLVAFGGTRTYHRMACAIEDAGFEIRDSLLWLYGTGFPKSHDAERAVARHRCALAGRHYERSVPSGDKAREGDHVCPACDASTLWDGWGTALKPGVEPIVLARKPLIGTSAENLLAHSAGALNIDACRVPLGADDPLQDGVQHDGHALDTGDADSAWGFHAVDRAPGLGRWPANVLHDGSAEVVALFPTQAGAKAPVRGTEPGPASAGHVTNRRSRVAGAVPGDTGSAARFFPACPWSDADVPFVESALRFFYSGKARKVDRGGSKHPTVKPLALMNWLCRLVTPPGGRVLDPFAGSGSTLIAAHHAGFEAIGCEMEPEYIEDITRRIGELSRAPDVSGEDTSVEMADFLA